MKIELRQKWVSKRKSEVIHCFRLELNSPPLFPVGPREEREKTILFPFPKNLHPTIFATPNKKTSMVTVSYDLALEFTTCKNDVHQIIVPINIEDNYPPRNPEDPPKPREIPPSQFPQNQGGYPQMPPQPLMSMPIIPDVRVDMAMQSMQPIQAPPMGSYYPGLAPQYPLYPQGSFQGSFGGNIYDQQFYPQQPENLSGPLTTGMPREDNPPAFIPLNQIPVMPLPTEPAGTGLYPVIPGFEPYQAQSFNPELHFAEMQSKLNDNAVPQSN